MTTEPLVMVVDDDAAVRDSLHVMLEVEGFAVEAFAGAREFLEHFQARPNCCVLLDVRMPEIDGLELLAHIGRRPDAPPVIMMTGHGDVPLAVKAMKLGARDFLEKPFAPETVVACIRSALRAARPGLAEHGEFGQRLEALTPRERDVLERLVIGGSNKEIARELGISPRTVEIHRARVMEKMQAHNLPQLVRMALAAGVDPGGG